MKAEPGSMIHQLPFDELRARYRAGELSPVDVTLSALAHAERANESLNAFALLDRKRALESAARSAMRWKSRTPAGSLDGMPLTVKEFAAVEGWTTRRGSAVTGGEPAPRNTVFVERLMAGGAVLIGKTRAPEFNWKGVTDSPAFGITRNPWDLSLTPGGSSGGCAAAVAAGIVRVSLASDAGGSIRIPSAFTGLVGLKPTFGRVPANPQPSAFSNIVHTGPIAASVSELAETLQIVGGASARDWHSFIGGEMDYVHAVSRADDAPMLRIGILAPAHWRSAQDPVREGVETVLKQLRDTGFAVKTVDFDVTAASAVSAAFYRIGCAATIRAVPEASRHRLDPELLRFAEGADAGPMTEYLALCGQRDAWCNRLGSLFDEVDVLMLPTMPILPFTAGRLVPEGWPCDDWLSWNPYTPAFNMAQVPAMSFPIWPDSGALPVGVQFVAPRYRDDSLLMLGAWLEKRYPLKLAPAPAPHEEVAAVSADTAATPDVPDNVHRQARLMAARLYFAS
ncbi:amidase [Variovorax sp. VNK109]|uniref:amidase n=1 Tax=Variovorax sp. VNK109 TaxID=3400919 RepID=UPI003C0EF43A